MSRLAWRRPSFGCWHCGACRFGGRTFDETQVPRNGEPGYHPLHKIRTVISGLRYAMLYDSSVTCKLVLSAVVLIVAFGLRALAVDASLV